MIKGTLFITTDINVVTQMMTTNKIVIVGEPDPHLVQTTNALVASVLLPPYNCMMAKMDGNNDQFSMLYNNYLCTTECTNFISALLRALYNGTNILLYSTTDEFSLYFNELYSHLVTNYGIYIGTPVNQFNFDPNFIWKICTVLYMYELFTVEEFFVNYPSTLEIPDDIIMKLIIEINPYLEDMSFNGYKKYFFDYKERIKSNNNKFLINVMSKV